ncbi:MAG TPA: hypothetical protein VN634_20160 [Candidatus Limnocylindrales bacterium]|nr:hypothetical protein [Candidatus Limnocylindrales bacterium]
MKSRYIVATSLGVMLLAACSANKQSASHAEGSHETAKAEAPAKEKGNPGRPAPAGSPLAKIQDGMADTDVRRILGEPDSSKSYMTGKQFIPYYYGPDTGRTEYIYKGLGRITLTRNRYSGGLKVIRVDYDPNI